MENLIMADLHKSKYAESNHRDRRFFNALPTVTRERLHEITEKHKERFLEHEPFCEVHREWQKTKDPKLLARMILSHEALIIAPARKYHNAGAQYCQFEDMLTAGKIALIGAIEAYDNTRNVWFWCYAKLRVYRGCYWCYNSFRYGFVHYSTNKYNSKDRQGVIPQPISLDYEKQDGDDKDPHELGREDTGYMDFINDDAYESLTAYLEPHEKELIDWHFKYEKPWVGYAKKLGVSKQLIDNRRVMIIRKLRRIVKRLGIKSLGGKRDPRISNVDDDRETYGYRNDNKDK